MGKMENRKKSFFMKRKEKKDQECVDKILAIVKPIKEGFTSHSGNPRKTPDLYQILVHVFKVACNIVPCIYYILSKTCEE